MTASKNQQIISISQELIHPEDGNPLTLEYFLVGTTGQEGETLYKLRVDMRNPGGDLLEREETRPFTGSLQEATALAETFAKGTVTPCVLQEMMEEWFEEPVLVS